MLNISTLVGRINSDLILEETKNNKKVLKLQLSVPRSFKNADGNYDTDFVPVVIFGDMAINTAEYTKPGDLVGVKGRLQNLDEESNLLSLIAEKITFLSAKNEA
ncbi:MAG: single-stranded DNA-binding protein [Clostridia bacterium]|nr:single-stranded DNA-binding protein [Clostridia bacterium]